MTWTVTLANTSTSLSLNDSTNYKLLLDGFSCPPPPKKSSWGGQNLFQDGSTLIERSYDNRVVTLRLQIKGTSQDNLITNIQAINDLLERGAEFSKYGLGSQLKLTTTWENATNSFVFYVLDGSLDTGLADFSLVHKQTNILHDVTLTLQCEPFAYSAASETVENWAKDPGFEIAGTALADWTASGGTPGSRSTSGPKHGSACLLISGAATGGETGRYQEIAAAAGEVWSIGVDTNVTAQAGDGAARLRIQWLDAGLATLSQTYVEKTAVTSGYELQSILNQTAPANTAWIRLLLRINMGAAGNSITAQYDDVMAVKAATLPTAWVSGHDVSNHNDDNGQAHINYLDIYGVPGDVPAVLQVLAKEQNTGTGFFLGARHAGRMTDSGLYHEGEDFATWDSEPADATASGGAYGRTGQPLLYDAAASNTAQTTNAITVTHTATGTNRVALAIVHVRTAAGAIAPTGVTYAGLAMTQIGSTLTNGTFTTSFWYRIAPTTGAQSVTASFASNFDDCVMGVVSFTGAHQTTPVGGLATTTGTSTSATHTGTAAAGDFFVGAFTTADVTHVPSSSTETERYDAAVGSLRGSAQTQRATATSVTFTCTLGSSVAWSAVGVAVKPLATGISVLAAGPYVLTKAISTPPTGTYRVIARLRSNNLNGSAVAYAAMGYAYGSVTIDPTVVSQYTNVTGTDTDWALYDLGSIKIPPIDVPTNYTGGNVTLRLALYIDSAGTDDTIDCDFVFLEPIDFGSAFITKSSSQDYVLSDGLSPLKTTYVLNTSSVLQSIPANRTGDPPKAHPDGTRLYCLKNETASADQAAIDRGFQVSITYLSRFLHVRPA